MMYFDGRSQKIAKILRVLQRLEETLLHYHDLNGMVSFNRISRLFMLDFISPNASNHPVISPSL